MKAATQVETGQKEQASLVIIYEDVTKVFTTQGRTILAVKDVSLSVAEKEFTAIVGPSGCGKTTLLRMCAGLLTPTLGRVLYKGRSFTGINTEVGFVTQESNLFPWLTLIENVEFSLLLRGVPKEQRRAKAQELIIMAGLEGFEDHFPFQLSGGMQKRGAIIRTLIYDPEVILMDEPFGPLDAQTRQVLQHELLQLWDKKRKTILFITHDLVEAIALSDTVVLLTRRPGMVKKIFPIPLARPRNVFEIHSQEGFVDIYREIWDYFKTEIKS